MKLRVLARGSAKCTDLDQMEGGRLCYIGRKKDMTIGHEYRDQESGAMMRTSAFPAVTEPVEVSDRMEHVQYVQHGDLWPADEATAQRCGVKFDPSFGGELDVAPKARPSMHPEIKDVK